MHSAPTLAPLVIEPAVPPAPATTSRKRSVTAWVRPLGGLAVLGFVVWRVGTGPLLHGLGLIDGRALAAAVAIGAVTTVCSAWRWSLVATGLGVRIPLGTAVADCYRSVFLNATLPGGVLGDVHRAVSHGRDCGDVSRGVRAVVWERTAGQLVQLVLALVVLSAFPSPVRRYLPAVLVAAAAVALGVLLLHRITGRQGRWLGPLRTAKADLRNGLLARGNWRLILVASLVAVGGHLATFLIAARTAGSAAPLTQLVPLTLLALLAMGVPANVGGFGPREGVAAWAFGAAGLTASQGVAAAVVYGALVLVASLPGAAVLLARRLRVPRLHVPDLRVPDLHLPELHLHELRVPELRVPGRCVPEAADRG
jgi:glycosyltransferase 2 family protein